VLRLHANVGLQLDRNVRVGHAVSFAIHFGQLVGVVGPYDLVTRYTYDAAHRLIQILDNITIPEHVTESSLVSPFSVDGEASPSSLAYVSNRLVSGWNAVLRWLKDWLSGIIRSAHAQTTPPLPNSYTPPSSSRPEHSNFPGVECRS